MMTQQEKPRFVLLTAAWNEAAYIGDTLKSVIAQTLLPVKWVIVSDGSTDNTDEIVQTFVGRCGFIKFIRRQPEQRQHNRGDFSQKVYALRMGYELLREEKYDFIGILDADITFAPDYYEKVLEKFACNARLGIAGGYFYERVKGIFKSHPLNIDTSVPGGFQMFRRQCYKDIDGFVPIQVGGEDWVAEVMARSKGWEVKSYYELKVFHNKPGSPIRGGHLKEAWRSGTMDYLLGTHPLFELAKCFRRVREYPYLINACLRLTGFIASYLQNQKRPVNREFIKYLRTEQIQRLTNIFQKNI